MDEVPPALEAAHMLPATWATAILVLAVTGVVILLVRRRERMRAEGTLVPVLVGPSAHTQGSVDFAALEAIGEAMIDAGYTVMTIHASLEDISRANGYPHTEIVVLPTALFVSARAVGEFRTGVVSSGHTSLRLHQIDALDRLVVEARAGRITPEAAWEGIRDLRTAPHPFRPYVRIGAQVLLSAALAVLLGASWAGVGVAAVLGGVVGTVMLLTSQVPHAFEPLVTVTISFAVSVAVFLLVRLGVDHGVLPSLVAPLVVLLPGALLTTGVFELAAGEMVSGAARVAGGFMQLVLLGVGIVAGAALVGIPRIELDAATAPLGPVAPWIAVVVFGITVVVNRGGRRDSIGWMVMVLCVAYAAQVLGDLLFGGVLSAFIGALVATPVAVFVSHLPSGPAAPVSFLPAFWPLVPGALGLVGVTTVLDDGVAGTAAVVTTVSTMVAIAIGILTGSALLTRFRPHPLALL